MDKHKVPDLLNRFLRGECSPEEERQVERWYALYDRTNPDIDVLTRDALERRILERIHQKIGKDEKRRFISPYIWKVAAAVLALIVAFVFILQNSKNSQKEDYVVRTTSAGERLKIVLSDSSEIWLNAFSRIRYPEQFSDEERTIELLEGEAFFQVRRDEARPFTVTTSDGLYTKVLGTSFTITSYRADHDVKVSVATGRVAVGNQHTLLAELSADQQIVYNRTTMRTETRIATDVNSWVHGEFVLRGHTLLEVETMLERYYGVRVVISESALFDLRCTGKFSLTQSPESIVNILCSLHNLSFEHQNNTITITPKR